MKCPKCGSRNVYTTKTYSSGPSGNVSDRKCMDCGTKIVCQTRIVAVDPKYGEGAYSIAKQKSDK